VSVVNRAAFILGLVLACDRGAPADATSSSAAVEEPKPTPSASANVDPAPVVPVVVEPQPAAPETPSLVPRTIGKASDVLTATLAVLENPASTAPPDLEKRAWAHYKAKEFHEAGEAFALLTKLDPAGWKHPFNAACAATQRGELERAQVFLIEALRRDPAAREKARRDDDLYDMRTRPWFAELIDADAATLAAWEIREPPPLEFLPYPPGTASIAIRDVRATPSKKSSLPNASTELDVSFEVEKLIAGDPDSFRLLSTCKNGDRYLHFESVLEARDDKIAPQTSKRLEKTIYTNAWPLPRVLDLCELDFVGQPIHVRAPYRSIARVCVNQGQVSEGACPDFERRVEEEVRVSEISLDVKRGEFDPAVVSLTLFVEYVFGRRPDRDQFLQATLDCDVGGKQIEQELSLIGVPTLALPGDSYQSLTYGRLDDEPTRCEIEFFRVRSGPKYIASIPRHCYRDGQVQPGPCAP
jgi:hypothetical protein